MRRVVSSVRIVVPATLTISRRHARRRQLQRDTNDVDSSTSGHTATLQELAANVTPSVSSLRSESIMAAPATTSLDRIRSQLSVMRSENMRKASEEKVAFERLQWLEAQKREMKKETLLTGVKLNAANSKSKSLTDMIQQEYSRANKPSDVLHSGKEVLDGLAQRSFLLQQKRFQDADEVLRKSGNESDTRRFVKLTYAPTSEETAQLVSLLLRMRGQWVSEHEKLSSSSDFSGNSSDAELLARMAWMQVLEQLSDEEVRLLWEANVLDAETLESLFSGTTEEAKHVPEIKHDEDDASHAPGTSPTVSLLDEKINYVHKLQYLQELTASICETELGSVPSIDLAPTLVKAQRRQFADITEKELHKLERYGETAAMRLSVSGDDSQKSAESDSVQQPQARNKPFARIDVPASILDRALTPSNTFLSAVAENDASLKRSLEGMERIKREALLDPEFQEAVRFAHAVEEASVAPHLYGQPIGSGGSARAHEETSDDASAAADSTAVRRVSKRERRAARSREFRGPMARSSYSPEAVPYFYNDMRSIVPPRGSFNLPDPAPTKAERAEQRGRRRRVHQHTRFRK
jgi:hypothetical protein